MIKSPNCDSVPICSLALLFRRDMILRRKSRSRLCKVNDSNRSCHVEKNKPEICSSNRKCKSLDMKKRKPYLANCISFGASPANLITSTPLKKSPIPDDNLKNSNLVSTTKKKSSNRNVSTPFQSLATPMSELESEMRVTRSRTSLSRNSNCRSTRSEKSNKVKLAADNLQTSKKSKTLQLVIKKISFNLDDSDINGSIKETVSNCRKSTLRSSSSRKKPLTSTPISSNPEVKCKSNTRTKFKKADEKNLNNVSTFHSKQNSDTSFGVGMMLRSGNSSKKASTIASCIEQSSIMNQDQTPYNYRNSVSSKRSERKVTKSKGPRSSKNKQLLKVDDASHCQTPTVKKDDITQRSRKSRTIYEYSSSFVKRHENCLSFCGRIPVDDLFLTSKPKTRKVQSDIIPADDLSSQIPVDDLCLTSKLNIRKVQSHLEIPKDDHCLNSRRNVRKVRSETRYRGPGKNTIKRKRAVIEAIKKAEESYEDDIYEGEKFDHFKDIFIESPEPNVSSFSIPTPKFGFQHSPVIRPKTPRIADCFCPKALALSRKIAEECMYRRNKKRKFLSVPTKSVTPINSGRKKKTFKQVMSEVAKVQQVIERLRNDESESDVDDECDLSF